MIVSLGAGVVPPVQVVLSGAELTSGAEWALEATYADGLGAEVTYTPRGGYGVGMGAQVVVVDYAAPIRRQVSYRLLVNGVQVSAGTITRTSPTANAVTNLSGSLAVHADRVEGDVRASIRRHHVTDVPGNPYAVIRRAAVAGKGPVSVSLGTSGADTTRMRELLDSNDLCYLLHSCDLPDCDLPLVELGYWSSESDARMAPGVATRRWSLTLTPQADPEPALLVGLSTWDEFDAHFAGKTWTDFNALFVGQTWDAFDLVSWSEAG